MTGFSVQTLFVPFHKDVLPWPEAGVRGLFLGAEHCPDVSRLSSCVLHTVYRFAAEALEAGGHDVVSAVPQGAGFDFVLCNLPKQKEEARYMLAQAASCLRTGGLLLAGAANDAGGKRIEKWMRELGVDAQSLSADKSRVVWGRVETGWDEAVVDQWLFEGGVRPVVLDDVSFSVQPGLFSWDRIDPGSALLAEYLPDDLSGTGADFGCGYGYLSACVLRSCPDISRLYCVDVDSRAVALCVQNMEGLECSADVHGVWADLSRVPEGMPALDWIVMNPPFHTGKATRAGLGQAMIETAARCLKPGGGLYMVANTGLPYEAVLRAQFSSLEKMAEVDGYKVYFSRR